MIPSNLVALSDLLIAAAYVAIGAQIVTCVLSFGTEKATTGAPNKAVHAIDRSRIVAVAVLFFSCFLTSAATHLVGVLMSAGVVQDAALMVVSRVACAIVSMATAIVQFYVTPAVVSTIRFMEMSKRGALQDTSRLIRLVTEHCTEVIATHSVDSDLKFMSVNGAYAKCFGSTSSSLVGQSFYAVVHEEDRENVRSVLEGAIQSALHTKNDEATMVTVDYRTPEKDDTPTTWVESSVSVAFEGEDPLVIIISRNVTWRKQLEARRREDEEVARNASVVNAKLHYITCTAHDLKTPLASFRIAVDLLGQTSLDPEQHALVNQASVCVELMKLTIAQAISLGKATSGVVLEPRRTTVFLDELLQQCHLVIQAFTRHVPLHSSIHPEVCVAVITDGEWVWQMVMNFLTNACKFTECGSISVDITLTDDQQMLCFAVTDTGIGVLPEMEDKLFKPFSEIQTNQRDGTGLGLWSVKLHCERLGGSCGMYPNADSPTGSVFWFKVPYKPDKSAITHEREEVAGVPCLPAIQLHTDRLSEDIFDDDAQLSPRTMQRAALVVDDVRSIRKLVAKALSRLGFIRIEECENGRQALQRMQQQRFAIVFCDYHMPFMSGPEAVKRFRVWETDSRQDRQTIIAMSANAEPDDIAAGLAAGFDGFLAKPLEFQNIKDIVDKSCQFLP